MNKILDLAQQLADAIASLPEEEKIEALNQVRLKLSEVSPFRFEPIDCVQWVKADKVIANDYNPNRVARPEMKLLEHSVREYGFGMPIITAAFSGDKDERSVDKVQKVVDGFHRNKVGRYTKDIGDRLKGYLPIANIAGDASDPTHLMAATIAFNRARGEHSVELMAELVKEMLILGRTETEIAKQLGMEAEELLRLKQMTGLAGLFKGQSYSKAWESMS